MMLKAQTYSAKVFIQRPPHFALSALSVDRCSPTRPGGPGYCI